LRWKKQTRQPFSKTVRSRMAVSLVGSWSDNGSFVQPVIEMVAGVDVKVCRCCLSWRDTANTPLE